tara:strand:+ start:187 stop:321 length:135 start_codon:yes stop_codon:yes gene_type:complete
MFDKKNVTHLLAEKKQSPCRGGLRSQSRPQSRPQAGYKLCLRLA